ncbi:MAG TPA: glycosyltransferase family 4 protein [Candidatus Limnocylindria bacterium]|nr:glycosyltransferase family 4 protein [Candidatus Limnocylindria bacterium]
MRIAQVAPLVESVPPSGYGGTERIVSYLTEELVRQGHDVTLYASGDSQTSARLIACVPRALRLDDTVVDPLAHGIVELERVFADAQDYDVIHWHVDYLHFPVSRRLTVPGLTTLHGRLDLPDLQPMYAEFAEMPLVSISNDQRIPLRDANWIATVYHGLPPDELVPSQDVGDYLAFLGRMSPEKRADRAIEVARRTKMPIKLAAKVDPVDEEYFKREIEPLLDHPGVQFVGEIGGDDKAQLLNRARALIFPIDWAEPFGLVMIEAMASGTPVIAYGSGSVPEVIEEGVSGFIVDDIDGAVDAVGRLGELDRATVRRAFEERFTAERMARDYIRVYEELIGEASPAPEGAAAAV